MKSLREKIASLETQVAALRSQLTDIKDFIGYSPIDGEDEDEMEEDEDDDADGVLIVCRPRPTKTETTGKFYWAGPKDSGLYKTSKNSWTNSIHNATKFDDEDDAQIVLDSIKEQELKPTPKTWFRAPTLTRYEEE